MHIGTSYNPNNDIPDLSGKVVLITGGTAGIGRETVLQFTKHHAQKIYFTGRKASAAAALIAEARGINHQTETIFIEADHSSLSSVSEAVKKVISSSDRLDLLICNAGIMGVATRMTEDGFEVQWMVNYLSHALMVKMLLPMLDRTAAQHHDARVVMVSSEAFRYAPTGGIIIADLKTDQQNLGMLAKWYRYGQSKLGMVLLNKQLASLFPRVKFISVHPGVIDTGLVRSLPLLDRLFVRAQTLGKGIGVREGAMTTCWAATMPEPDKIVSGGIYGPVGVPIPDSTDSQDKMLRERLWKWTNDTLEAYTSSVTAD